jgi:hypothetical protein
MLHPDFSDVNMAKGISPGQDEPMEAAGRLSLGHDAVIREVRLHVDYAQFDDNSALGRGGEGERQVKLARDGAALYKKWLVARYLDSGRSLATVRSLIEKDDVPEELGLKEIGQILGAKRYRLSMLKVFKTQGQLKAQEWLNRN